MIFLTLIDTEEERSRFEQLYYQYRHLLFYCAKSILKNDCDAEDAVQNALLYIAQHMNKFKSVQEREEKSLMIMITTQKALDFYRMRKRRAHISLEQRQSGCWDPPDPLDNIAGVEEGLPEILREMPPKYRDVLVKRLCYGYEYPEIAKEMGTTEANVRKMLQRAREQFIKLYQEKGGAPHEAGSRQDIP